ncbi:SGNH/GDSL hydrolase family protein [Pseudarthrobacter equi]|uniref:SGNH/GDSL hydrolase family protein n=1 Tax=Pseudarthrobacter equi TaxID=728066 RepID=UPI0021C17834|nr:SGNH/GDSL hydrolase family protein [Pseudarthrobacter equi]MCT9626071.1 SGNH/GDSL hydrolase family protein [Pseudarthrobacter equi]
MGTTALRRRLPAFAAGLATLALAIGSAALPAGAAPPVKDVDLVAVGDSYTAGIGASAPDIAPCTQAGRGYVDLLKALSVVDDDSTNAACAGAVIVDRASDIAPSVTEQITGLTASGTLSVRTELVTLTAGANDINFSAPLTACAGTQPEACAQAIQEVQAKFPALQADLVEALIDIRRAAPHATIAVFGYPLLFDPAGGPALLTPEAQELVNAGTRALNNVIAQATDAPRVKAKAVYVDVTEAFAGHAVNSERSWIHLGSLEDPQNFHPTPLGHQAYADALQDAVNLNKLARP